LCLCYWDFLLLKAYLMQRITASEDLFYKMQNSQHCLNNWAIHPSKTHYSHSVVSQSKAGTAISYDHSTHSLDRLTGDGPTGRCALQTSRSLAVSQAASAASPTSTSSWRIHVCRGRPHGRFHSGLASGRRPARVLTARRSASCAGTAPCRRRT